MKVEIYSTPNCKYCQQAKEFFEFFRIKYIEYNVAEDAEKKAEAIELTGKMGVPVIRIGDDVYYGFAKDLIAAKLGIYKD